MTDRPESATTAVPLTVEYALAQACRLLRAAEMETDRSLMKRYEALADSWSHVAAILTGREQIA